jgi:2-ketocyclohexanecarboxyl-CoA hydrolase
MVWTKEWTKVEGYCTDQTIYEKKYYKMGGVARVTLANTNPKGLNFISPRGMSEMCACFREARMDDSIGCIILTGAGDKSFCAGGDLREEGAEKKPNDFQQMTDVHQNMRLAGKPIIAVVKGYAIGAGNHYAYHCDLTVAADNAIFGQVGPKVGSPASGTDVSYLARIVGQKRAREMWMLCRRYTAQQALEWGLVNFVFPLDKIDEEVEKICLELLEKVSTCLKVVKASFEEELEEMPHHTIDYWPTLINPTYMGGPEMRESMQAFMEKRTPDWGKVRGRPANFKSDK